MESTEPTTMPDRRKIGDYIGTVSTQGRVTIPEEVRRLLDIQPQDKVVFRVTEDTIELSGKLPSLEELAGSLVPLQQNTTIDEMIQQNRAVHQPQRFATKHST
mgnify:CR=1 FL=1